MKAINRYDQEHAEVFLCACNSHSARPERKAIQLGCVVLDEKIAPEAGLQKVYNKEDAMLRGFSILILFFLAIPDLSFAVTKKTYDFIVGVNGDFKAAKTAAANAASSVDQKRQSENNFFNIESFFYRTKYRQYGYLQ